MGDILLKTMTDIRQGHIVLPDIQRSFIWNREQIYGLYDSLFRGYPIGHFLFWKAIGTDDPEHVILYHPFTEAYEPSLKLPKQDELKANESKMFVLDGQQRLQSLYFGVEGVYEGRDLYLDILSGLQEDEEDGTRYFVRFLNNAELAQFFRRNPHRRMIRLKDFLRLVPGHFTGTFRTKTLQERFGLQPDTTEYATACTVLDQARSAFLWPDLVPILKIDEHASAADECKSLEEVAEIFVRINDGGTKLSRMDLIFSFMKSRWHRASEEMEALCITLNSKGEFAVDKDFVLRCLMVFSGRPVQYQVSQMRKADVMHEFEQIFDKAKRAMLSIFDFLTENRGGAIRTWRLLSGGQRADRGYNILIPVALYLYLRPTQEIPASQYRRLRRFLYTAILSRYAVRYVEARLDRLAREIREAHVNGRDEFPIDTCIALMQQAENFVQPEELLGRPNTLDPLLNILAGGNVDFKTLLDRNAPQRDHIFPQSILRSIGVKEERIHHYANMHLLGAISNIIKSNKDPEQAFASYDAKVLLGDDYLIPKELLSYQSYDKFLETRAHLIQEKVAHFLADSQMATEC